MAQLLGDQTLVNATGDAFKSSRLERMLTGFSASYKLYWFKGVFDEALEGNDHVPFERIAARMIASAWYPVTYFRLNLGASDKLEDAVNWTREVCELGPDASKQEIVEAILESDDRELLRKVRNLCNFVPYRLIRPFYDDRFAAERTRYGGIRDAQINSLIFQFNRNDTDGAPYRFNAERNAIEINHEWARYFRENKHVIQGWFDMKLVNYLQTRNPSVPAIPLKIYPPVQRDLSAARKYWEEALADHPFKEIYSGLEFNNENYLALGPMSIDHFVHWRFVLHDEPWNLTPMFRDINSSKGSKLPVLDSYLLPFCEQQFDALLTLRRTGRHKKSFEAYACIDPNISYYERNDASFESFSDSLRRVIIPLHQIALNQGFPTWQAETDYAFVGM